MTTQAFPYIITLNEAIVLSFVLGLFSVSSSYG